MMISCQKFNFLMNKQNLSDLEVDAIVVHADTCHKCQLDFKLNAEPISEYLRRKWADFKKAIFR